jgi:DNA-binding transcriptional ArsR family regulator
MLCGAAYFVVLHPILLPPYWPKLKARIGPAFAGDLAPLKKSGAPELENLLSLRQPTVSRQLGRLRFDGLVTTRREGKAVYCRIADDDIKRVIALLYEIFCKGEGQERKSPRAWR